MKNIVIRLLFVCSVLTLNAQEKLPEYDLCRRWAPQNAEQLQYSYTITPHWFTGSSKFWYEYKTSEGTHYYVVDPSTRSKQALFNKEALAVEMTKLTHSPYDGQHLPLVNVKLKEDNRTLTFQLAEGKNASRSFEYDYQANRLTEGANVKETHPMMQFGSVSPDKKQVLYAKNRNLYAMSYEDYQRILANPKDSTLTERALTTDGVQDFGYGMSYYTLNTDKDTPTQRKPVMGIWSADGRYFATIVTDSRTVKDLWVINSIDEPRPTLETYKYAMPGEKEATQYHLYVFDLQSGTRKEIQTRKYKDQSLSLCYEGMYDWGYSEKPQTHTWMDANTFILSRRSRDYHNWDVCSYTLGNDSIETIVHEQLDTYIDSRVSSVLNKRKEIILLSEQDGWQHLYLYDQQGKLKKQLTKGAFHVEKVVKIDPVSQVVYFSANGRERSDSNPYYEHLYRVNMDGSDLRLLTPGDYFHLNYMDEGARFIVDNFSRVNTVPETALYDNTGKKLMTLEVSDFSQLFAAGYKFPEPIKAKAADGVTDLYGVMYKPFDFDSTKVYPVINYVYPGPQQEGSFERFCPMNPRTDRLAQAGFIVVCMGHRGGAPGRSKWYHNYGYGNLRDYPLADHVSYLTQLCNRYPFMDINRVGIHGHSGGGFMSTAAILLYPDFFKAAVSCAGNHDNNIYNRQWSERHHGVNESDSFAIHVPANQELAKNLKGHLLLIHGDMDDNVHPGNTIRVVNALIKAGKRFDMLIMPGKHHHFEDYNEYFYWKMVDYFSEHLKGKSEKGADIEGIKLGNWFQGYQD